MFCKGRQLSVFVQLLFDDVQVEHIPKAEGA